MVLAILSVTLTLTAVSELHIRSILICYTTNCTFMPNIFRILNLYLLGIIPFTLHLLRREPPEVLGAQIEYNKVKQ